MLTERDIKQMKREAKQLKKDVKAGHKEAYEYLIDWTYLIQPEEVTHAQCLDALAREEGYTNWAELVRTNRSNDGEHG